MENATPSDGAEVLYEGRFLRLIREGHWEYAQRTNTSGAVGIIAVTDDRQLVVVEQHRIPVHGPVLEIPAGLIGDEAGQEGEPAIEAAKRELLEETGYEARDWRVLIDTVASAGLSDEATLLVLATGLKRVGSGGGVAHETITVHHVPLDGLLHWVSERVAGGCRVDAKVFAADYLVRAALRIPS